MDPKDVGMDLPDGPVQEPDLPEEGGATGDEMPEGGVRDEDDDLSSTPID
jgi:hypothetical protein